jgi:hypothetical protein
MLDAVDLATMPAAATTAVEDRTAALADDFDYGTLDDETRTRVIGQRDVIRQHCATGCQQIIAIGRALRDVKASLPHGQFRRWLASEFGWSERTARNYMRAAELFESKSATVADLPPTVLYELASGTEPEAVRAEVLTRAANGEAIRPRDVRRVVGADDRRSRTQRRGGRKPPGAEDPDPAIGAVLSILREMREWSGGHAPDGLDDALAIALERTPSGERSDVPELMATWGAALAAASATVAPRDDESHPDAEEGAA